MRNMCKNNQDNIDYIIDDRPREMPEDVKNMTAEEIEEEFKKRFPNTDLT